MSRRTYSRSGYASLHSVLYKITLLVLALFLVFGCKEKSVPVEENPEDGESNYLVSTFDSRIPVGGSESAFGIAVDSLTKRSIIFSGKTNSGTSSKSLTNITILEGEGATISIAISPVTNLPTSYLVKTANDGPVYQLKISDINLTANKIKYQLFDVKKKVEIQTPGVKDIDPETSEVWGNIQKMLSQKNYNARVSEVDCQELDLLTTSALGITCRVSYLFVDTPIGLPINRSSCRSFKRRVKNGYGFGGKCSDWAKRNAPAADCVAESLLYAWDLDGGTPLPCCQREGCKPPTTPPAQSTGDPHLTTFDGVYYDHQYVGEFVATRAANDNMEVQIRQSEYLNRGTVAVNTGIAIQTGTDVVCVTSKPNRLYVNKQLQDLTTLTMLSLKDGASIVKSREKDTDVLNVRTKNNDVIKIAFQGSQYLDYFIYLAENRKGKVTGLLGNNDGNRENDVQIRNGESILKNGNLYQDQLREYANSWRISNASSLFYYETGKNTDSYTDKNFPRTRENLTNEQKAKAESICRSAGVATEPFLSNCIVDVAISNDPAIANSSAWSQQLNKFPAAKPVPVIDEIDVKRIVSHLRNSFILKTDGTLWASGLNSDGMFGTGQPETYSTNNKFVKIMEGIRDIAPGIDSYHMLFLKDDGLWAAGNNYTGQIGNGTAGNQKILTAVKIMTDVKAVATGIYSSYAVKNDGTLWAFGVNNYGQLGDGSKLNRNVPVKVMSDVKSVSAGTNHALVLKTDGSLWGFGSNYSGELGVSKASYEVLLSPRKLLDDVRTMSAGQGYSMAIKNNKELWVSGSNYAGQLGSGNYSDVPAFKKIMDNVADATTSYEWSLILQENNTLWATGRNLTGSLGLNTSSATSTPVQTMSGVKYVVTGYGGTFILKTDNTVWSAGTNGNGQLGTGTTGGSSGFSKVTVK